MNFEEVRYHAPQKCTKMGQGHIMDTKSQQFMEMMFLLFYQAELFLMTSGFQHPSHEPRDFLESIDLTLPHKACAAHSGSMKISFTYCGTIQ